LTNFKPRKVGSLAINEFKVPTSAFKIMFLFESTTIKLSLNQFGSGYWRKVIDID